MILVGMNGIVAKSMLSSPTAARQDPPSEQSGSQEPPLGSQEPPLLPRLAQGPGMPVTQVLTATTGLTDDMEVTVKYNCKSKTKSGYKAKQQVCRPR